MSPRERVRYEVGEAVIARMNVLLLARDRAWDGACMSTLMPASHYVDYLTLQCAVDYCATLQFYGEWYWSI
jgi:hypothetical protein